MTWYKRQVRSKQVVCVEDRVTRGGGWKLVFGRCSKRFMLFLLTVFGTEDEPRTVVHRRVSKDMNTRMRFDSRA